MYVCFGCSGFKLQVNVLYLLLFDSGSEYKSSVLDCIGFMECKIVEITYGEKFDEYICNFGGNNDKNKMKNAVLNKFKVLCSVGRYYRVLFIAYVVDYTCVY